MKTSIGTSSEKEREEEQAQDRAYLQAAGGRRRAAAREIPGGGRRHLPADHVRGRGRRIYTNRPRRTNERTNGLLRQRPETNGQSDTEAPRRWGERGHARRQRSRTRPPVSTGSGSDSRFGGACVRGRRRDSARSLPFPAGGVHLLGAARWFIQFATCPVS